MHLVKDDRAGTHTVSALRVVGAALDLAEVLSTAQNLFCMVKMFGKLRFILWILQRFDNIFDGGDSLFFVVRANVHIVMPDWVIRADQRRRRHGDHAVFTRATANHCKERLEARQSIGTVGAQPKPKRESLPRKKTIIRKIPGESEISPHSLGIHINIFGFKNAPDHCHQCVLLFTGAVLFMLHLLDIL